MVSGSPVASEITSGRAVTAIMSRIAEEVIPRVRRGEESAVALDLVSAGGRPLVSSIVMRRDRTLARPMDYLLALLQGLGIAAAIGIRPFLPVLLAGALAGADLGRGLRGHGIRVPGADRVPVRDARRRLRARDRRAARGRARSAWRCSPSRCCWARSWRPARWTTSAPPGGQASSSARAAAALGWAAARSLFGRVRARLDTDAAKARPALRRGHGLAHRRALDLFPPLALIVVAALAWLLIGGRRRAGQKYAGCGSCGEGRSLALRARFTGAIAQRAILPVGVTR